MRTAWRGSWVALGVVGLLALGAAVWPLVRASRAGAARAEAELALARRDFAAASAHLDRALSLDPDPAARLLAARAARRRGDLPAAQRHLRAAETDGAPVEAVALERRLLRVQDGDLREAAVLVAFCDAHESAPETPLIIEAFLEGALKALEDVPATGRNVADLSPELRLVEQWQRLAAHDADRLQALVWRGQLRHLLGRYRDAVADLREALDRDPDHFAARLALARTIGQEAPAEAMEHLARLQARHPDNQAVRLSRAAGLRTLGRLDESARLLDGLLADDPDAPGPLLERGLVDLDDGKPAEAERRLRRVVALAPGHPEGHFALGRALALLGRADEAAACRDRFRRLDAERTRRTEGTAKAP